MCISARTRSTLLVLLMFGSLAAGCTTPGPGAGVDSTNPSSTADRAAVDAALFAASEQLARGRAEQLDLYAPRTMEQAIDALAAAQKLQARAAPDADIVARAKAVGEHITTALSHKGVAETTLREAFAHRRVLEQIGAPQYLPREYAKTAGMLRDLAETLETGNTGKALKEQEKVLARFSEIEIDTLKAIHLTAVETMLDKAARADAVYFAPATLESAGTALKAARKFIETTPRDLAGVQAICNDALLAAQKTYNVATEARQLVGLDQRRAEVRALRYFSLMEHVNEAAGIRDFAGMSLSEQARALAQKLEHASGKVAPGRAPAEADTGSADAPQEPRQLAIP